MYNVVVVSRVQTNQSADACAAVYSICASYDDDDEVDGNEMKRLFERPDDSSIQSCSSTEAPLLCIFPTDIYIYIYIKVSSSY